MLTPTLETLLVLLILATGFLTGAIVGNLLGKQQADNERYRQGYGDAVTDSLKAMQNIFRTKNKENP